MRPLVILCVALAATACRSDNEPEKLSPGQVAPPAAPASSSSASTARPSPNPHAAMPAASGGATAPAGSALQYSVPNGWIVQTPSSAMRKAQFLLPKEASDGEDAQLVLTYFGGEGGSKKDNLERWAGQFVQPDGRDSMDVIVSTSRTVNGLAVTEASISGTYAPGAMPGQGDPGRKENWSMLAAIIETPSGPYYAKLTGPRATVGRWEPSFREWISSLKPQS